MPITVEWLDPAKHILTITYTGRWTWDDFYEADELMRRTIDETDGTAHLIIDVSRNVYFPPPKSPRTPTTCWRHSTRVWA